VSFLSALDLQLFRAINNWNGVFMDEIMYYVSTRIAWIPTYALVLYLITEREKRDWKRVAAVVASLVLIILACDQVASHIIKPLVERPRPCYALLGVHVYDGHCGGAYGFVSSHAANFFGMAAFLSLYLKQKRITWICYGCAAAVAYSRVYLGVHYPGDVLFGGLLGVAIGAGTYTAFSQIRNAKALN